MSSETAQVPRSRWSARLYGPGASRGEVLLVWTSVGVGAAVLLGTAPSSWPWWRDLVAVVLAVDLMGGVTANSLGSAKAHYAGDPAVPAGCRLRSQVGFALAHVHPFVLVALFPGASIDWAAAWYVAVLAGVLGVRLAPLHLQRPLGTAAGAAAVLVVSGVEQPAGLAWVGPVLVLKLVLAHAVTETPFRPSTHGPQDRAGR